MNGNDAQAWHESVLYPMFSFLPVPRLGFIVMFYLVGEPCSASLLIRSCCSVLSVLSKHIQPDFFVERPALRLILPSAYR